MKSAEEVAEEIVKNTCVGTYDDAIKSFVKAFTAYAEERVNEANGKSALAAVQWAKDSYEKARAEALEEAAKVVEGTKWQDAQDSISQAWNMKMDAIAERIRALKEKA